MNEAIRTQNPLLRLARRVPPGGGRLAGTIGRAAGLALALVIAFDQDYDRTRALTAGLVVLTALSLLPVGGALRPRFAWIGAGVVFFGGALLAHLTAGAGMLLAGTVAALGAAVDDVERERGLGVAGFFMGFGIDAALTVAVVLLIAG